MHPDASGGAGSGGFPFGPFMPGIPGWPDASSFGVPFQPAFPGGDAAAVPGFPGFQAPAGGAGFPDSFGAVPGFGPTIGPPMTGDPVMGPDGQMYMPTWQQPPTGSFDPGAPGFQPIPGEFGMGDGSATGPTFNPQQPPGAEIAPGSLPQVQMSPPGEVNFPGGELPAPGFDPTGQQQPQPQPQPGTGDPALTTPGIANTAPTQDCMTAPTLVMIGGQVCVCV